MSTLSAKRGESKNLAVIVIIILKFFKGLPKKSNS